MTKTKKLHEIKLFVVMMIESLEKNEPMPYNGCIGCLKHIKILIDETEEPTNKK